MAAVLGRAGVDCGGEGVCMDTMTELKSGSTYVLQLKESVSQDAIQNIYETLKRKVPECGFLVLTNGLELVGEAKRILVVCTNPENGEYKAFDQDNPDIHVVAYSGPESAVGDLVIAHAKHFGLTITNLSE